MKTILPELYSICSACARWGLPISDTRFLHYGKAVGDYSTADELGLQDGDVIDIVMGTYERYRHCPYHQHAQFLDAVEESDLHAMQDILKVGIPDTVFCDTTIGCKEVIDHALILAINQEFNAGIEILLGTGKFTQERLNAALWQSVSEGNVTSAKAFLREGADIESKSKGFRFRDNCVTPLQEAIDRRYYDIEWEVGSDQLVAGPLDESLRIEMVKMLIDHGADINSKALNGKTPLMLAVQPGGHRHYNGYGYCQEIVEMLVTNGCDIEAKDETGNTAYDIAKVIFFAPFPPSTLAKLCPAALKEPEPVCPNALALEFAATLGLPDDVCFDHANDRCYCTICYRPEYPSTIDDESGSRYVVPRDWCRIGIAKDKRWHLLDIFNKWSVSYHGVKSKVVLQSIFQHGTFMIPGDKLLDGTILKSKKCGGRQDKVFYTSPSIRYAGLKFYEEPQDWTASDGTAMQASVVLQCRQKPGTYNRQGETMDFERQWPGHLKDACLHVNLAELEWLSKQKEGAIPYGLLIRVWRKELDLMGDSYKSPVD